MGARKGPRWAKNLHASVLEDAGLGAHSKITVGAWVDGVWVEG